MSKVSGTSFQLLFDAVSRGESKCPIQTNLERRKSGPLLFLVLLDSDIHHFMVLRFTFLRRFLLLSTKENSPSSPSSSSSMINSIRSIFLQERDKIIEILERLCKHAVSRAILKRAWCYWFCGNSESIILKIIKSNRTRVQSIQGIPSFLHLFSICLQRKTLFIDYWYLDYWHSSTMRVDITDYFDRGRL